jgi:hypothetical protein
MTLTPDATSTCPLRTVTSQRRHKSLGISGICESQENLSSDFNGLQMCPKNRHLHETGMNQGKIGRRQIFSAELSPDSVDSFPLATAVSSVQP